MEKEEDKQPATSIPDLSPKWKMIIVAVILIIIVGLIFMMWRGVGMKMSGGGSRKHRWGARGGNCGCSAAPMP